MIDYEDALRLILAHSGPRGTESVSVDAAAGRVLAADVTARISSPPFDKSAMDGYAVRAEDVQRLPAELQVIGQAFAGRSPRLRVGRGQACEITTGAPVPPGADTVVMVEHTEPAGPAGGVRAEDASQAPEPVATSEAPAEASTAQSQPAAPAGEGRVRVLKLTGSNICPEGENIRAGEVVLRAGQVMTPLRIGTAAMAGAAQAEVVRLPSAALLCTGTEVVEPGEEPGPGRIYNSNGPMLLSLLAPLCREVVYLGIVADDEARLEAAVWRGLEADLLVVSGGVSMGRLDLVPAALKRCGVRQVFHKVAVKPGKPAFFGATESGCVLGMPGNPESCFVIFKLLAWPALAAMAGHTELPPRFEEGAAAEGFPNKGERMNVLPCRIQRGPSGTLLHLLPHHGSADIVGPAAADGCLIVPRGSESVAAGQRLRFFEL